MPEFLTDLECGSCGYETQRTLEVENTSGPEGDDANAEGAPECTACGDVDWQVMGCKADSDA